MNAPATALRVCDCSLGTLSGQTGRSECDSRHLSEEKSIAFPAPYITGLRASDHIQLRQDYSELVRKKTMPVLMVALLALSVFGGIGALLATAVVLESRQKDKASK